MASLDGVAVELHRDMDLLSPPLPEEIERKREAMEQPTADTLDVDVRTVLNISLPPPHLLVSPTLFVVTRDVFAFHRNNLLHQTLFLLGVASETIPPPSTLT